MALTSLLLVLLSAYSTFCSLKYDLPGSTSRQYWTTIQVGSATSASGQDPISMEKAIHLPLVPGAQATITGTYSDATLMVMKMTVSSDSRMEESCEPQFMWVPTDSDCVKYESARKDLPECKQTGDPGCLARQTEHVSSDTGIDWDDWNFSADYRCILGASAYTGRYRNHGLGDGCTALFGCAMPRISTSYSPVAYVCTRALPALTINWELEVKGLVTDSGSFTFSEVDTTSTGEWGSITADFSDADYVGIAGKMIAIASSDWEVLALYQGHEDFYTPSPFSKVNAYPTAGVAPIFVAQTPSMSGKPSWTCLPRASRDIFLENFAAEYLPLQQATGCAYECSIGQPSSNFTFRRDVCAYQLNTECTESTVEACCKEYTANELPEINCAATACAGDAVELSVVANGVVDLSSQVREVTGKDIVCMKVEGYVGKSGVTVTLTSVTPGTAYIEPTMRDNFIPTQTVAVFSDGALTTTITAALWSRETSSLQAGGETFECDISDVEDSPEYQPPDPDDPDRPDPEPGQKGFPWWTLVIVIMSIVAFIFLCMAIWSCVRPNYNPPVRGRW